MSYGKDLRKRVLDFVAEGGGKAEAARRFCVHPSTVYERLKRPTIYEATYTNNYYQKNKMELFIIVVVGSILYVLIAPRITDFFKSIKDHKVANESTLLPFIEWFSLIKETNDDEERESLAYSLILQSAILLVQNKVIPSVDEIMDLLNDSSVCKTNFIITIISTNSLYLIDKELDNYRESFKAPAQTFFSASIYAYVSRYGDVNHALETARKQSQYPFKGWDN